MEKQTQGASECFPTSLCMALGFDWANEIRPVIEAEIAEHFGRAIPVPWGATDHDARVWAVHRVIEMLGAPANAELVGWVVHGWPRGRVAKFSTRVPKTGRGLLALYITPKPGNRFKSGAKYNLHAVAYEDGMIYDPSPNLAPMTVEAYEAFADAGRVNIRILSMARFGGE